MFCKHNNFEKIEFIIEPNLREHLHTSCDIPKPISKTLKKYKNKRFFPKIKNTPEFNKLIQKHGNLWFLDTLSQKDKTIFFAHLKNSKFPENYFYQILEKMKNIDYCED